MDVGVAQVDTTKAAMVNDQLGITPVYVNCYSVGSWTTIERDITLAATGSRPYVVGFISFAFNIEGQVDIDAFNVTGQI